MVVLTGYRIFDEFINNVIYTLRNMLPVLPITFVRSVEVLDECCVVTGDERAFVLVAALAAGAVEGDEGADEVVDVGSLGVFVKGDVGVVEKIFVEDVLLVEDVGDVLLM